MKKLWLLLQAEFWFRSSQMKEWFKDDFERNIEANPELVSLLCDTQKVRIMQKFIRKPDMYFADFSNILFVIGREECAKTALNFLKCFDPEVIKQFMLYDTSAFLENMSLLYTRTVFRASVFSEDGVRDKICDEGAMAKDWQNFISTFMGGRRMQAIITAQADGGTRLHDIIRRPVDKDADGNKIYALSDYDYDRLMRSEGKQ